MELNIKDKMQAALYDLRYQHPSGVTTHSVCSRGCGHSARGGGVCRSCLLEDLKQLGVGPAFIGTLQIAHEDLQSARHKLESLEQDILNSLL